MKTETLDRAFAVLERTAIAGERCPQRGEFPLLSRDSNVVAELAQIGRIRIEVYGRNYRVVTILTGPHRGKSTAPAPTGRKPYKIIDQDGTRLLGGAGRRAAARGTVSLPRVDF